MSRTYLPLLMLVFLIIEGTLYQWILAFYGIESLLVPRFLIVLLVFIGIYSGRASSIIYGLCFGILYDIVYTELLGVYMFGFASSAICLP